MVFCFCTSTMVLASDKKGPARGITRWLVCLLLLMVNSCTANLYMLHALYVLYHQTGFSSALYMWSGSRKVGCGLQSHTGGPALTSECRSLTAAGSEQPSELTRVRPGCPFAAQMQQKTSARSQCIADGITITSFTHAMKELQIPPQCCRATEQLHAHQ